MAEKRIDRDGKAYTYEELAAYYRGRYPEGEIAAYWSTLRAERRVDDRSGRAYTYGELVARYGCRYWKFEIDAYWDTLRSGGAAVPRGAPPHGSQNPWRPCRVPAAEGESPVPTGSAGASHREASVPTVCGGATAAQLPLAAPSPPCRASVLRYQYALLRAADPAWPSRPWEQAQGSGDAVPPAALATIIPSGCAAAAGSAQPASSAAAAAAGAAEQTIYVRCGCEWSGFRCLSFAFLDTGEADAWRCTPCIDPSLPCCRCFCEACFPEDDYDPSQRPFWPVTASGVDSEELARAGATSSPTAAKAETDGALAVAPVLFDHAGAEAERSGSLATNLREPREEREAAKEK